VHIFGVDGAAAEAETARVNDTQQCAATRADIIWTADVCAL
jgi:hypothetical protein